MKKPVLCVACVLLAAATLAMGAGCNNTFSGGNKDADYTRYPTDYDPNVDSWEQIDAGDNDVDVVWFLDFDWSDANISSLIYKRTGVRVTFRNALTDDHSELNTMVAGNKLPGIISIEDTALRVQLAEEGYVYALNKLAESYAPSMLGRVDQEHWDYYKSNDGNTYALSSHFYSNSDIEELEELGARQYVNGTVTVRRDYLEDYIAYRTAQDSSFDPDKEITKPSGFIEMCKWVKQEKKIPNTIPTVALSPFKKVGRNDKISETLSTLMDIFGVKRENADGSLAYPYGDEKFLDVMNFLNTLYTEHLAISANFAYTVSDINTLIINGRPFAYIGADQEIRSAYSKREKDAMDKNGGVLPIENEYVSILMTDEEGNAPLMQDYTSKGMRYVMITKNCEREDRVIKVLDYLMSELGNREMTYGENIGESYDYSLKPGETNPKTGKVSKYGEIAPTKTMYNIIANSHKNNPTGLGIGRTSPIYSPMYARLTAAYDDYAGITASWYWPVYKFKKTYFDYCYSNYVFRFPLDVSDRKALNSYLDQMADIEKVWIDALPVMIMASDAAAVKKAYDTALALAATKGVTEYMAYRDKCFQAYKDYLGIEYAWPSNDPGYVAPEVKLYGSADKYMDCPVWVYTEI